MTHSDKNNERGIKISLYYRQQDWRELDLERNNIEAWQKAIEIFKDRIEGRYFKQIELLDENPNFKIGTFSGFAIMSLVCLLIETLEQFWEGNIETSRKSKTGSKNNMIITKVDNISNDSLAFFSFFQRSHTLSQFFDSIEKANIFYIKIRCGLLHQGQTKGKSLIHIRSNEPILSWIDDKNIKEGLSVQRRKFVKEIRLVYEKYIEALSNSNLNFKKRTLKKKMDYIVSQK